VAVDLAEINHTPMVRTVTTRSPDDHQAVAASLKARIEMLEADELAKLEASSAVRRGGLRARTRAVRTADGRNT
jgi:hypothetical protein